MNKQIQLKASKTNESCLVFNKSEDYSRTLLYARVTKIEIVNGKETDLRMDKPVYAIHLADVKEV